MTSGDLMRKIERFIHSEWQVTSARIARAFGEDPEGAITCAENLVAPALSQEASEGLIALVGDGGYSCSQITRTAYHIDGLFSRPAVSYVQRPHDAPGLAPGAFNSPLVHRRVMEAIRLMGGVGSGPVISDSDRGHSLCEIHS